MPPRPPNSASPGDGGQPGPARAAAAVLALQAVLLAGACVLLAISGFRPETVDRAGAEILAVIGLSSSAAVLWFARGIAINARWARSPVLVLELICLPIAYTVVTQGHLVPGVALAVSALAVLGLMGVAGQLTRRD
jgi:hypothetical protein